MLSLVVHIVGKQIPVHLFYWAKVIKLEKDEPILLDSYFNKAGNAYKKMSHTKEE